MFPTDGDVVVDVVAALVLGLGTKPLVAAARARTVGGLVSGAKGVEA